MKNVLIAALLLLTCSCLMAIKPIEMGPSGSAPIYVSTDTAIEVDGQMITLRAGTPVMVEVTQTIDINNINVGQIVPVRVKFNVVAQKKTLISAGVLGSATIISIKKPKGWGKAGKAELQITSVPAVDNQQIPLSGIPIVVEGESKKGLAIGLAVGLGILTIWALGLGAFSGFLIKGKAPQIRPGTTLSGSVASDIEIEVK